MSEPIRTDADGYFTYQHAKWVIIFNSDYGELRKKEGFSAFADLPDVEQDAINIKRGIKELGARDEDIIEFRNVERMPLMKELQQINRACIT